MADMVSCLFPSASVKPEEYASLALELIRNTYFNAALVRSDGVLNLEQPSRGRTGEAFDYITEEIRVTAEGGLHHHPQPRPNDLNASTTVECCTPSPSCFAPWIGPRSPRRHSPALDVPSVPVAT